MVPVRLVSGWKPDSCFGYSSNPDGPIISSAWSVPVLGGNPVLLQDDAIAPSVSPDGSLIAFTRGRVILGDYFGEFFVPWTREIWVMGPNGEDARKLVPSDGKTLFRRVQWSPDGSRIACLKRRRDSKDTFSADIAGIALKGGPPTVILPALLRD